jgi:hypothetical protein
VGSGGEGKSVFAEKKGVHRKVSKIAPLDLFIAPSLRHFRARPLRVPRDQLLEFFYVICLSIQRPWRNGGLERP